MSPIDSSAKDLPAIFRDMGWEQRAFIRRAARSHIHMGVVIAHLVMQGISLIMTVDLFVKRFSSGLDDDRSAFLYRRIDLIATLFLGVAMVSMTKSSLIKHICRIWLSDFSLNKRDTFDRPSLLKALGRELSTYYATGRSAYLRDLWNLTTLTLFSAFLLSGHYIAAFVVVLSRYVTLISGADLYRFVVAFAGSLSIEQISFLENGELE